MKYIVSMILFVSLTFADQKSEDETLLINLNELSFCSAIYYIRTATNDVEASKFFSGATVIMRQIAAYHYKEINKKNARNKDIDKFVDIYLGMLEDEHKKNKKMSNTIYKKVSKCDGALMYYINNIDLIDKNLLNPKTNLRNYLLTDLNFRSKKPLPINDFEIETNFNHWATNNYMTATKFKNKLHEDFENKGLLKK